MDLYLMKIMNRYNIYHRINDSYKHGKLQILLKFVVF